MIVFFLFGLIAYFVLFDVCFAYCLIAGFWFCFSVDCVCLFSACGGLFGLLCLLDCLGLMFLIVCDGLLCVAYNSVVYCLSPLYGRLRLLFTYC